MAGKKSFHVTRKNDGQGKRVDVEVEDENGDRTVAGTFEDTQDGSKYANLFLSAVASSNISQEPIVTNEVVNA